MSGTVRSPAPREIVALVLLIGALSGCARGDAEPVDEQRPVIGTLDEAVAWTGEVRLEENDEVINVSPRVYPDGDGFLVADSKEAQIRRYGPDGRLRARLGRRGAGPGEFQYVIAAVRLSSGEILAADMMGTLTIFSPRGDSVRHTARTPLGPLYEVVPLDDSLVVLVGRVGASAETPLMHLWDVRRDTIVRSFFPAPQGRGELQSAYMFTGFADAAVRGDTIATIFALSDTVRMYTRDGREVGKVAIPFRHFRRLESGMPQQGGPAELQEWMESYSAASGLFWLSDGTFLVQYYDQRDAETVWRLLRMTRDGRPLMEIVDSPKLLAGSEPDALTFVKPGAEAPNVWSRARLRSSSR